ncbi:MAG TPA: hypothetical protein VNT99_04000 [Methylomirabilota bacterium]|nr:hypothetical protein [Methylomirabilota bacterium]
MKTLVSAVALAALVFAGCQNDFSRAITRAPGDDLILRAHFIGSDRLLKDNSAPSLNEVWKLKSSVELRNHALDRFATLPFLWLSNALPKDAANQAALFRPLLDDALARESFVEWHTSAFSLAAKLPDNRARDWDTNLRRAMTNWKLGTPSPSNRAGTSGWELTKAGVPVVRFTRVDDWVAVTVGPDAANVESNALARVKQFASRPSGAWLEGDANLAQWKGRFSLLDGFSNLPAAHFSLSNRADFVRTLVQFDFPKPHQWKAEPWQIPTNIIWDPLMDFTVVRGISGALEELPVFGKLGWNPAPSQIYGWGVRDFPFQVNYAFPARNVSRQLKNIEPRLRSEITRLAGTNFLGFLMLETNQLNLSWRGMPLAAPQVEVVKDGTREFAVVSFFPFAKLNERPPQELFTQIERPNLVLYDWESTQHRMNTWRQVYQLGEIGTHRMLSPTNALDQRWQSDVMPLLRDCVTELLATAPAQMTLVRKSSIGLSSIELVTLSRWIESASFPAFGFYPPQSPKKLPGKNGANR